MKTLLIILILFNTLLFSKIAQVSALQGDAELQRDNKVFNLKLADLIEKDDQIKTSSNSKVQLIFKDETIITIGKNSSFNVEDYVYDIKKKDVGTKFKFLKGKFRIITGKIGKISPKKFKLRTKNITMGIRGTQILMDLSSSKEKISCVEGEIYIKTNENKILDLKAGRSITIDLKTNKIETETINNNDFEATSSTSAQDDIKEQNDTASYDNFINKYNDVKNTDNTTKDAITNALDTNYKKAHILKYQTSVSGYIEERNDGVSRFDNDSTKLNNAQFSFEIDFSKAKNNNPVSASFSVKTPSNSWVKGKDNTNTFRGNITDDNQIVLEYKNDDDVDISKRTIDIKNSNLDIEGKNVELRSHSQNEKILIENMKLNPQD